MFNLLESARNKIQHDGDLAEHLPTSKEVAEEKFGKPGLVDFVADTYNLIKAKVTDTQPSLDTNTKTIDMAIHSTSDPSDLSIDLSPVGKSSENTNASKTQGFLTEKMGELKTSFFGEGTEK